MSKAEIQAKIEFQEIIGDANEGGFQPVRFTRIKYRKSIISHIDIRRYQRGWDDNGEDVFFPTKLGFRFPESEFKKVLEKYSTLPTTYIHSEIMEKCFNLLSNKEYESAVLQAFKIIETSIRARIKAKPEEVGIKLMRKAFHPENGLLTDFDLPKSEREAFSNYLAGAFGYYKNPCSHRDIELNFIEAFERIVVASDLLKKIDPEDGAS
jgi:uncharacterized protein (TIGR02391 family)